MDPKLLTEKGWTDIADKFKIKDNGLQKALFFYWTLDDDDFDFRLKAIVKVGALAGALKRAKEVAAVPEVVKYLTNLVSAAKAEEGAIAKAEALAEKTAKAEAAAKKAETDDEEEKEEPAVEKYKKMLKDNIAKVKNNAGKSFEYVVCVGDSGYNVMVAPAISAQHKSLLSKVSGGKTKFLPPGSEPGKCRWENNGFTFDLPRPVTGLAKGLQVSIQGYTDKKYKIKVGIESEEGDEPEEGGAK